MIRKAAAAGRFYPTDSSQLDELLRQLTPDRSRRVKAVGMIVPHAGYRYSGEVAGSTYAAVQLARRFILLCPNHTGVGAPVSIMSQGAWETPLGTIDIDSETAGRIQHISYLVQESSLAHQNEHAVEVQLPFLQHLLDGDFQFVPIAVGTGRYEVFVELGKGLAEVVSQSAEPVLLVASTDMNHFESAELTLEKDRMAIDRILALDSEGLFEVIHRNNVSMCGFGPTIAVIEASRRLGARNARLIKHTHSGEITGEKESVVGYAGFVIL
jgi:MEMO1 family protein